MLPDQIGPHAAMTGGFTILDFPEDPSVVYLESSENALFLEDHAEVEHHRELYQSLRSTALSVNDSMSFIRGLLDSTA